MKLIASFGVTTSRYKNTIPVTNNKNQIDTPLGPCIVRWDIKEKKRLNFFQAHHHIVTFMQKSPLNSNIIATTCHGGEIKIWNENWELLSNTLNLESDKLTCAEWSLDGTKILACTEANSMLHLIEVIPLKDGKFKLEILEQKKGEFPLATFNNKNQIFCVEEIYTKKEEGCNLIIFDQKFKEIKKIQLEKDDVISILASNDDRKKVALGSLNKTRNIFIIDTETLKIECQFKPSGSGGFKSMLFENDLLYIPSDNGLFQIFNSKGEKLKEYKIPSGCIYTIEWASKNDNLMWIVNEESLYQISLDDEESNIKQKIHLDVSLHSITCCGVDFSHDSKYLVSGDFLGNVFLWDIEKQISIKDVNIISSVRCICWKKNSNYIQIGSMDGSVYNWNFESGDLQRVISLTSEIICMKWDNELKQQHKLAIGTRDGKLAILQQDLGDDF